MLQSLYHLDGLRHTLGCHILSNTPAVEPVGNAEKMRRMASPSLLPLLSQCSPGACWSSLPWGYTAGSQSARTSRSPGYLLLFQLVLWIYSQDSGCIRCKCWGDGSKGCGAAVWGEARSSSWRTWLQSTPTSPCRAWLCLAATMGCFREKKLRKLLLFRVHPLQPCPQSPAVLKDPIAQTHRGSFVHVKRAVGRIPSAKHWPKPMVKSIEKHFENISPKIHNVFTVKYTTQAK